MRSLLLCFLVLLLSLVVLCNKRDPYDVLGVRKAATKDEIKSAYKQLVRQWHPDRNKAINAPERFIEIQEAYEVLQDPRKRAQYDYFRYRDDSGSRHRSRSYEDFFTNFNWDEFDLDESVARNLNGHQVDEGTAIPTVRAHFEEAKRTLNDPKNHKKAKKWINEQMASASSFWQQSILPGLDKLYKTTMENVEKQKREFERMRKNYNNN